TISIKQTKNSKKENKNMLHVTLRNRYNPGRTSVKSHKIVVKSNRRAALSQVLKLFKKLYKNTASLKIRKALARNVLQRASALLQKN
ncbi:hypothetical protein HMI56_005990, partial [Coelomomyces lativittatus]